MLDDKTKFSTKDFSRRRRRIFDSSGLSATFQIGAGGAM